MASGNAPLPRNLRNSSIFKNDPYSNIPKYLMGLQIARKIDHSSTSIELTSAIIGPLGPKRRCSIRARYKLKKKGSR